MSFEEFQDGSRGGLLRYWKDFSNSESLCHCDASHSILAQSYLWFERRCCLKKHGGHLGYRNRTILAILNLYLALKPPIKFQINLTYGLGGDVVFKNFKMVAILDMGTKRF